MAEVKPDKNYPPVTPPTYKAALPANTEFEFVSAHTIFPYQKGSGLTSADTNTFIQEVFVDGNDTPVFRNVFTIYPDPIPSLTHYEGKDIGLTVSSLSIGSIKVVYTYRYFHSTQDNFKNTVVYNFSVVENRLPLKPWTITEVINRTLDLAEPIRKGEKPRFKLNAVQAQLFDKILAPQFSFTKQTLRECLQEIGKVVHGEPRLKPSKEEFTFIQTQDFVNGKAYIGSNNLEPYNMNDEYFVFIGSKPYKLEIEIVADNAKIGRASCRERV